MKQFYKERFALTGRGAENLTKATVSSFLVYCVNMVPAILIMFFAQQILDNVAQNNIFYLLASIATLCVMFILLYSEYDKLYKTTYEESANLRIETAGNLSRLPLSYFSKHDISDISQTIMADVEGIEHAMSHSIPKVGGMLLFFPIISLLMLLGNWKLGLAVIIPTLLSFVFIPLSKGLQVKGFKKHYDILRRNSEAFQENIEMQMEIKSYGLVGRMQRDLYGKMEETENVHFKSELAVACAIAISTLFGYISLAIVMLVGIRLILAGELSVLYLLGYFLAAVKIKESMDASKEGIMEIYYLTPKIDRIRQIRKQELQHGEDCVIENFDICLKDVDFSYKQGIKVLDGCSFKVKQGEVTAIVGASGSGKTSILRLISRLYDYEDGEIVIDGKELKDISTDSLFSKISIVFQDVTLFNTTVMENIRLGRQSATDDEVKKAAKLANCTEFIDKLSEGYETIIGENGAELSGGERQRISIARAFLKNAPILILDEIAASLDVDNEKKIQDSINQLVMGKTVLIISHRMKSIENANKIVVLNSGTVEAEGTHAELLRTSDTYRNLIEKTELAEGFKY
ncbi:MAG: ABC transporter ATP-binding protein [Christensenellales bacterium]